MAITTGCNGECTCMRCSVPKIRHDLTNIKVPTPKIKNFQPERSKRKDGDNKGELKI